MPASLSPAPTPPLPARALLIVAFGSVYVFWGSTYLGIRLAIEAMPPLLMAGTRSLVAGAVLFGLMRGLRREPAAPAGGWRKAMIIGGGLLLVGNGGVTLAEQYVPTGLASLLIATVPLWLAVLGWLTGVSARPRPLVWIGFGLGLVGVYVLAGGPAALNPTGAGAVPVPGHGALGVVMLLTAALVWAGASLYSKENPIAPTPLVGVAMQLLCGGALLTVAGLLRGEATGLDLATITPRAWAAWLYLIAFGSLVGFTAYVWLLGVTAPALVGTYAFVNPVVAVLLGWLVLGEKLTPALTGGAAFIVVAVALVVLGGRKS